MKEKVLYVKLPENAQFERVNVTDEGIEIVYTEEVEKTFENVYIPKPKKLIGGTDVYRKPNIPYWYCKIKNGRDEFMHLYMEDLTEQDLLYDSETGAERIFATEREKKFKEDVLEALANKPKEGFRWLPVYEPSEEGYKQVKYVKDEKPFVGMGPSSWDSLGEAYSKENLSQMCSKTTYFLLLLRWLKDGMATFAQIIEKSYEIGNYRNTKYSKIEMEKTGKRSFGGLCGFVGNTYKYLKNSDDPYDYSLAGGPYSMEGRGFQLSDCSLIGHRFFVQHQSVGLIELKK